jgi:hypothetical protein
MRLFLPHKFLCPIVGVAYMLSLPPSLSLCLSLTPPPPPPPPAHACVSVYSTMRLFLLYKTMHLQLLCGRKSLIFLHTERESLSITDQLEGRRQYYKSLPGAFRAILYVIWRW